MVGMTTTPTIYEYNAMRLVADRYRRRWSPFIFESPTGPRWVWRQMVGGREKLEPMLPGELAAVEELKERFGE